MPSSPPPETAQHGYDRTEWWFEKAGAMDVFDTYLAGLVASAPERPVRVLEVGWLRRDTPSMPKRSCFLLVLENQRTWYTLALSTFAPDQSRMNERRDNKRLSGRPRFRYRVVMNLLHVLLREGLRASLRVAML